MRRGTSSACAKRPHSSWRRPTSAFLFEDTSFARSRDPCTSIVTELCGNGASRNRRGGAAALISRSGKPMKVGANRHRGLGRRTNARLAARHRWSEKSRAIAILTRSCVTRKKRKMVMAIVPARKRESRAQCPYVVVQLQKSAGSILAPNKLARSALKKGGGTSERGPSEAQSSA